LVAGKIKSSNLTERNILLGAFKDCLWLERVFGWLDNIEHKIHKVFVKSLEAHHILIDNNGVSNFYSRIIAKFNKNLSLISLVDGTLGLWIRSHQRIRGCI